MTAATAAAARRTLLDEGHKTRAMVWVMGVMLFLTVLAAALGLGTWQSIASLDRQLAGQLTVQLIGPDAARATAVADGLRRLRGVRAVTAVPREQLVELVRPWLGDAGLDTDLPMPAMIDVTLADGSTATADVVVAAIGGIAPAAHVDRAARWLAPVRSFIASLAWLAAGIVVLMALATSAVVLLAARAGLDTHRDTIDVLHMLGSTDVQVSRLFQRRIALDTLIGGTIGTVAAMGAVWVIGRQVAAIDSVLVSGVTLDTGAWGLLALLPLAFAALATLAARVAVLRTLKARL
ncbi:permease [Sphingomonas sp. Leaf33]|uniref:cell division protein FtsX n=1 Tax=Sphingomonas sp. Leaf33 TaxID=1736215 RepID=UPI0006F884B2|nr:FtsX-like permease family protein [Sphingomonas sp. Leaf33]KQN24748.1 permease [Sphingomonas sp. Leaf33]